MTLRVVCAVESWPYLACDQKQAYVVARDSSVVIATPNGLDGPGIESRRGRNFPPVQTGPGAHPASCPTGHFPGGAAGARTSSAEVKERVEIYLHSPSGPP